MEIVSYAQNFEDVVLWRALNDISVGFYIDIGAFDPKKDSVTKLFYDRGWRGINVEPVKSYFDNLCADRPRDLNLNVAIAEKQGDVVFYEIDTTGLSTTVEHIAELHRAAGWHVNHTIVPAITLTELLDRAEGQQVHFLKIDIEGAEADVLAGTVFKAVRPWIVMVEATTPLSSTATYADWEKYLTEQHYVFVYFDGLNRFYLAEEHLAIKSSFEAPPNLFDSYKTAYVRDLEDTLRLNIEESERKDRKLRNEITDLNLRLRQKDEIIAQLENRIIGEEQSELLEQTEIANQRLRLRQKDEIIAQLEKRITATVHSARAAYWRGHLRS